MELTNCSPIEKENSQIVPSPDPMDIENNMTIIKKEMIEFEGTHDVHFPYKVSIPVLAEDWNSEADQHWDECEFDKFR